MSDAVTWVAGMKAVATSDAVMLGVVADTAAGVAPADSAAGVAPADTAAVVAPADSTVVAAEASTVVGDMAAGIAKPRL
jgi:hypothetical protein